MDDRPGQMTWIFSWGLVWKVPNIVFSKMKREEHDMVSTKAKHKAESGKDPGD